MKNSILYDIKTKKEFDYDILYNILKDIKKAKRRAYNTLLYKYKHGKINLTQKEVVYMQIKALDVYLGDVPIYDSKVHELLDKMP